MTTSGIEAVFLETHNWGKAAKFFQALGYELEFETGWGTQQMTVRDPEGRLWSVQAPADS